MRIPFIAAAFRGISRSCRESWPVLIRYFWAFQENGNPAVIRSKRQRRVWGEELGEPRPSQVKQHGQGAEETMEEPPSTSFPGVLPSMGEEKKGISTDNSGSWEAPELDGIEQVLSLIFVELLQGVSYLVGFEALFEFIC